jgi:hypothetical protein
MIALTTTYIAIQQWRLERYKWRLAVYDKRFETYRAVVEFIGRLATAQRRSASSFFRPPAGTIFCSSRRFRPT